MKETAKVLDFEKAAKLRDEIRKLESEHGLAKESLLKKRVA